MSLNARTFQVSGVEVKTYFYASVAQLVESTTDNRVVTGPSPVVCTRMYMSVGSARQAFDDARGESRYTKSAGVPRKRHI